MTHIHYTLVQHPAGMADSPAKKAGPATEGADRPTPKPGPSAPHQDASDDVPTSMEEDDLLGEDLVDYEASPGPTGRRPGRLRSFSRAPRYGCKCY